MKDIQGDHDIHRLTTQQTLGFPPFFWRNEYSEHFELTEDASSSTVKSQIPEQLSHFGILTVVSQSSTDFALQILFAPERSILVGNGCGNPLLIPFTPHRFRIPCSDDGDFELVGTDWLLLLQGVFILRVTNARIAVVRFCGVRTLDRTNALDRVGLRQ